VEGLQTAQIHNYFWASGFGKQLAKLDVKMSYTNRKSAKWLRAELREVWEVWEVWDGSLRTGKHKGRRVSVC
jgi:hypothetical protein